MKKSYLCKMVCCLLALFLSVGAYMPAYAVSLSAASKTETETEDVNSGAGENKEEKTIKKDETIYVNLNPDGTVREQIITDKIHSDIENITVKDKTDLKDIEVIKGGEIIENNNGNITWQLQGKDLYYRGKSDKKLPFDVAVKYFLDGKEVKPDSIAGKSGKLKITFDFKNNLSEKRKINDKESIIYSPMAVAAAVIMPNDKFSNVSAEDCAKTNEGENTIVAITCLPGLYSSLDLDKNKIEEIEDLKFPEHFEITAHVVDFEMSPIAVTAMAGFPDDEDFDLSFIDDLDADLKNLRRIKDSFETMDDDRGIRNMLLDDEKINRLQSMSKDIDSLLELNTDFADNLPKYVTENNVKILSRIIDEMAEVDLRYLKDFDFAENYEDSHKKEVNNRDLGKGVEKALDLFDMIDVDDLALAYKGNKELKENASEIAGGAAMALNLSQKSVMELVGRLDEETQMDVMLKLMSALSPEDWKNMIDAGVPEADVKMLRLTAAKYMAVQNGMQPVLEATVAIGEFPRDAYLRKMLNNTRELYDDFLELYPTISLIKGDLKDEHLKESFDQSPAMVDILVRLKKQLDENEDMADSLRKLQDDENIAKIKDIINTLDDFEKDEIIEEYSDKIEKLQDIVSRKDVLSELADTNNIYTDRVDNMDSEYKFILKTDDIKVPQKEEKIEVEQEESGFKKLWNKLFK